MSTAMAAQVSVSTSRPDGGRFDIHRSIHLLDEFMSAGGWRTPKSAQNHLAKLWGAELTEVQTALHDQMPDGVIGGFRVDLTFLRWQAEIAWDVWFAIRSYGDALKWQEGGRLNGKVDQLTRMPMRAQQYRLDTRFEVQPTVPDGIRVPSVEELLERIRSKQPRPVSVAKRAGRPRKVRHPVHAALEATRHALETTG
jgi:hypothetical protein